MKFLNKKVRFILLLFFISAGIFLGSSKVTHAYTTVSYISGDTVWTKENSPYVVTGSVTLPSTATLTINPGVIVKFKRVDQWWIGTLGTLIVDGVLKADATLQDPIYFTSFSDDTVGGDTNGDGNATLPGNSGYPNPLGAGIQLTNPTSPSVLNNVYIKYNATALTIKDGTHQISNVHLINNQSFGIWMEGGNVTVENAEIGCSSGFSCGTGVYKNKGDLIITGSNIHDNVYNGILNHNGNVLVTGSQIENNGNYYGSDSNSGGGVEVTNLGTVTLRGNTIKGERGKGISINAGSLTLESNTFINVTGAIYYNAISYSGGDFISDGKNTGGPSFLLKVAPNFPLTKEFIYVIQGEVKVPSTATLTIEPGVIVKFDKVKDWTQQKGTLIVDGVLNTNATPQDPIYFTSFADDTVGGDTNGDGNATLPGTSGYPNPLGAGIQLTNPTSPSTINNVYIKYNSAALTIKDGTHQITSVHLTDNYYGIWMESGNITVENAEIMNNITYGVYVQNGALTIKNSSIHNNSSGLYVQLASTLSVDARNNWWGDQSGPYHLLANSGGKGNGVGGLWFTTFSPWLKSDFSPWLKTEPPTLSYSQDIGYASDNIENGKGIEPNKGTIETEFTFKTIYTDADNDAPQNISLIVGDGIATTTHALVLDASAPVELRDGNYANGEQFIATSTFPKKAQRFYHFETSDGKGGTARKPETGDLQFSVINVPVIIVPAIGGSYLYDANETNDLISCSERELWPNICKIQSNESNFFRRIKLNGDGITNENNRSVILGINEHGIIRHTPFGDIFKGLIKELEDNGFNENPIDINNQDLFTFPYDWRLDVTTNSAKLKDKIDSIISKTGSKKVNIIAHSMGGLLTKFYTTQYGSVEINKIIFIGVPHLGAPKAFETLMYGNNDYNLWGWGIDKAVINEISQNMPSIYQLLPSEEYTKLHKYIWNLTATDKTDITGQLDYQQTKQLMIKSNRNEKLFKNAEALHGLADTPGIDAIKQIQGVKTYNIIGCGTATIGEIRMLNKKMPDLEKYEYALHYIDGDETVPVLSAKSFGNNNNKFFVKSAATHGELPSANGIREFIAYLIAGSKFNLLEHKNIALDENICNFAGKAVSFHSPIELHIYDSQNRHTGPTTEGFIENNIPGVQYDVIEDNKFAFLPDGETYTITGQATDTGTFNTRITTYENSEVTETRYYNEIPLNTLETNTTFTITSNQTDYTIQIDQDGDKIFESQTHPSSVLNAEESQDLTKPKTTISLSGNQGQNNWYISDVKIGFSATDDNSGILKTEYSLDNGKNWNIYQQPFTIAAEGATTILYLSTDRAGNYELVKSQEIKIDKTPPEAKIFFDKNLKQLKIEGTDNLSSVAVIQNNKTYTLTDEAGHTLDIVFDKLKTEGKEIKAEISALHYDGILAPAVLENKMQYEWSLEKNGSIKELNQRIEVEKIFDVRARYHAKKNETVIDTKTGDDKNEKKTKQTRQGFAILVLITNSGEFDISYYH